MFKRIYAVLRGKFEEVKIQNRMKRIDTAISVAKVNAESDLIGVDDNMLSIMKRFTEDEVNVNEVLIALVVSFKKKDAIKKELDYLDAVKKYLNEDIKVEEDTPKKK